MAPIEDRGFRVLELRRIFERGRTRGSQSQLHLCSVLLYCIMRHFGIRQKATPDTIKIRVERALAYESTEFEVNEWDLSLTAVQVLCVVNVDNVVNEKE